ncbi:MlaD family protein [Polluticoccus soli]|uniref:MlaD family protein n=1 Tax=Polluticoccus soli TaxID=3034150 RepID=UPI0023E33CE9|nr:MlaD family protein [Flavipsychrobacter sp. JY13-12]
MNEKPTGKRTIKNIASLAIILLIVGGYYFLKGSKMFVKDHFYFAYFADVQGLQMSSPVMIKGVRVGKISDIDLGGRNVKITLSVKKDIQVPEGTIAKLASGGITGDKIIDLKPGNGPAILADYSTLQTGLDTSLLPVSVRFTPIFETAKIMLRSMDSTLQGIDSLFSTGLLSRASLGIISFEDRLEGASKTSARLNNNYNFHNAAANAEVQSRKLVNGSAQLNQTINDAAAKSEKLSNTDIANDVASLGSSIKKLGSSFHKLDTSMSGFGKLLNNKNSYHSMTKSFDTLNRNAQELQKAPPVMTIFKSKKIK